MVVFGRNVRGVDWKECVQKHVVFDGTHLFIDLIVRLSSTQTCPPHPQEKQAMQAALLEVIPPEELPVEYGGTRPGDALESSALEQALHEYVEQLQ